MIGLTISTAVVKANANVNSSSRGVALKSMPFPPGTSQNQIDLRFAIPQGGCGFFFRAPQGASLTVKVLDSLETVLEVLNLPRRSSLTQILATSAVTGNSRNMCTVISVFKPI
jgi:hypothetical protein